VHTTSPQHSSAKRDGIRHRDDGRGHDRCARRDPRALPQSRRTPASRGGRGDDCLRYYLFYSWFFYFATACIVGAVANYREEEEASLALKAVWWDPRARAPTQQGDKPGFNSSFETTLQGMPVLHVLHVLHGTRQKKPPSLTDCRGLPRWTK